jgi:hypothetical protein
MPLMMGIRTALSICGQERSAPGVSDFAVRHIEDIRESDRCAANPFEAAIYFRIRHHQLELMQTN